MAVFDAADWIWPDVSMGRQPQGPFELRLDSDICKGLARLAIATEATGGRLVDSVNESIVYTSSDPGFAINPIGKAIATAKNVLWEGSSAAGHTGIGTGDLTLFYWGVNTANNSVQYFCQIGLATTVIGDTFVGNRPGSLCAMNTFGGTLVTEPGQVAGVPECLVVSRRSGVAYMYRNGVFLGSSAHASSVSNNPFSVGSMAGSAKSVNLAGLYVRGLSHEEALFLSGDPIGALAETPLRGVYLPYWAPSASGAAISGGNSATTFSTAKISNGASVSGVTPAQPTPTGALVSGSTISATGSAVTSSSASVTATVPGAVITASGSAATGSSGDLRAQGSVSGAAAAVTSSAGAVIAGTNAAAITGAGSAVPGGAGDLLSASTMAAVNAASPSAAGDVASRSSLAGASQAVTGGTSAITSGSAPSAAIAASTSAITHAIASLIAQCTVAATGAARASGSATLSTGAPDTPGELILSELKIATISVSALKFATIDAEVLNNG